MERVNITIGPLSFDHANYDAENDVLYLHVGAPQSADGEETPEGHVVRYAPGTSRVVGLTVLGARHVLQRDGHLAVTVQETVETTAEQLARALAAHLRRAKQSRGAFECGRLPVVLGDSLLLGVGDASIRQGTGAGISRNGTQRTDS